MRREGNTDTTAPQKRLSMRETKKSAHSNLTLAKDRQVTLKQMKTVQALAPDTRSQLLVLEIMIQGSQHKEVEAAPRKNFTKISARLNLYLWPISRSDSKINKPLN